MDNIGLSRNPQCCKINKFRDRPKAGKDPARRASLSERAEKEENVPSESYYNRVQCPRCRYNVREAYQMLGQKQIDFNDVICEHCKKKVRFNNVCSKCEDAVTRIISGKDGRDYDTKTRLKIWLSKVQQELKEILTNTRDTGVDTSALKAHIFSETYLGDLYGRIHSPVSPRKPDVTKLLDSGLKRQLLHSATRSGIQRPSTALSMPDLGECCHVPECIEKWAETIEARERGIAGPGSDHSDLFGDMKLHDHEYKKQSQRTGMKTYYRDGNKVHEDIKTEGKGTNVRNDDERTAIGDSRFKDNKADKDYDGLGKSLKDNKKTQMKDDLQYNKTKETKYQSKDERDQLKFQTQTKETMGDVDKLQSGRKDAKEDLNKVKSGTQLSKSQKKEKGDQDILRTKDKAKVKSQDEKEDDITKILKAQAKQGKIKIESKQTETDDKKLVDDKKSKSKQKDQPLEPGEKVGGKQGGPKETGKSQGLTSRGDKETDKKGKDKIKSGDELEDKSPKRDKEKPSKEDEEFLLTIKRAKAEREKEKQAKLAEEKKIAEMKKKMAEKDNPQPKSQKSIKAYKQTKPQDLVSPSDRALEALNLVPQKDEVTKIIVGQKILKQKTPRVTLEERENQKEKALAPALFKAAATFDDAFDGKGDAATTTSAEATATARRIIGELGKNDDRKSKEDSKKERATKKIDSQTDNAETEVPAGITRYALSDRTFIDKGWTQLPTEKVVRKMNVYRMRPAHPEFDWFARNKNRRLVEYDTGEKMAEIDDNGRGRWYYRNGHLALDYYDAEELNAQQRFVLYSSGEPDERGRAQPITVLGTFDYLGNGVVFDHKGKIRLKYNQTEGVVLDRSLGPVSHWKWHSLNDPPVLQQVMIDTQLPHKDPDIAQLGAPSHNKPRQDNEEMLAIEFDNFIKEKSKKLSQKFKPFQIKMKALKINECFSLRVLDQASIYLIFRDGSTNLKLNMGMILDHQEIVDTDTAELGEVASAAERRPARTDSLAQLQRSVARARQYEQARQAREHRLRPPAAPAASADRLLAARAPSLRRPLLTVPAAGLAEAAACDDTPQHKLEILRCRYLSRKPRPNNIYYDSRL